MDSTSIHLVHCSSCFSIRTKLFKNFEVQSIILNESFFFFFILCIWGLDLTKVQSTPRPKVQSPIPSPQSPILHLFTGWSLINANPQSPTSKKISRATSFNLGSIAPWRFKFYVWYLNPEMLNFALKFKSRQKRWQFLCWSFFWMLIPSKTMKICPKFRGFFIFNKTIFPDWLISLIWKRAIIIPSVSKRLPTKFVNQRK